MVQCRQLSKIYTRINGDWFNGSGYDFNVSTCTGTYFVVDNGWTYHDRIIPIGFQEKGLNYYDQIPYRCEKCGDHVVVVSGSSFDQQINQNEEPVSQIENVSNFLSRFGYNPNRRY